MVALNTFNNLPEERKTKIIEICLSEFALQDYEDASLNEIIKNLALAKGSFYRYFKNKKMLYSYLFNYCIEYRLSHDKILNIEPSEDFFELFRQHFHARLSFEEKHPLASAFLHKFFQQKRIKEVESIQNDAKSRIVKLFIPEVMKGIQKNSIRKDIDPELMAFYLTKTQKLINDFIWYKYKIDYCENILTDKTKSIRMEEIKNIGNHFIDLIKNGMAHNLK